MNEMSWREEYATALQARADFTNSNHTLIAAYGRLADYAAKLLPDRKQAVIFKHSTSAPTNLAHSQSLAGTTSQLQNHLAEVLDAKNRLLARVRTTDEILANLKVKSKTDERLLKEVSNQKLLLTTKIRDRDEELRGKTKLLEDVQDEMISLNLQMNMAEQQLKRLRDENKDLVDRWMARMSKEADAMNEASSFT